jgi:hypothetical protein
LGKIAGALLGMLLIGNNSRVVQQQTQPMQNDRQQYASEEMQKQHPDEHEVSRPVIRR